MNTEMLENRLREKIVTEAPRPGFETRIQAMAREPYTPEKKGLIRRFAVPVMAVLAILIVIAPKNRTPKPAVTEGPEQQDKPIEKVAEVQTPAPVEREIQGLKNDAKWTMSLFQKALPSLPVQKKKEE